MAVGWQLRLSRMAVGAGLISIGALALAAPLATGTWSLQLLSLFPLTVGVINLHAVIRSSDLRSRPGGYASSALALALAMLLYVSPSLVVSGVIGMLLVLLVADGVLKLARGVLGASPAGKRIVPVANGAASVFLAFLGWLLWRTLGVDAAVGVVVGGYTAASGWAMLLSPSPHVAIESGAEVPADQHPDVKLGLGANDLFSAIAGRLAASGPTVRQTELYWLFICGLVLFVIHLSRMQSTQTWLGLVSPLVAILGDVVMAVALGGAIVLPLRLLWRRLTRPIERSGMAHALCWDRCRIGRAAAVDRPPMDRRTVCLRRCP